jgi:hypothetical protein
MILGYPGRTNRYDASSNIEMQRDDFGPNFVKCRDIRLKAMKTEMDKSAETRLKLASEYAGLANYWKFYDLESKQLKQKNIVEQRREEEKKFQAWANGKTGYENLLSEFKTNVDAWKQYEKHRQIFGQGIMGINLIGWNTQLTQIETELKKETPDKAKIEKGLKNIDEMVKEASKRFVIEADRNILASISKLFYDEIDKEQHPKGFFENVQEKFGALNNEDSWKKYAQDLYANALLLNPAKWAAFMTNPTLAELDNDLAFQFAKAFTTNWTNNYVPKLMAYNNKNTDLGRVYMKAQMEMNKGKKEYYPDANSTMRFTYGKVASYVPRDGVFYNWFTTANGILQKYKAGDDEFDMPEKALELMRKKDFGQYADPVKKDLVVCFLNTCDITGGNSGSPVLNGKGELVGLAFDGNSEDIKSQIAYDVTVNRCINVDIRYVLWCIDKVGGGTNIIKELKLVY